MNFILDGLTWVTILFGVGYVFYTLLKSVIENEVYSLIHEVKAANDKLNEIKKLQERVEEELLSYKKGSTAYEVVSLLKKIEIHLHETNKKS